MAHRPARRLMRVLALAVLAYGLAFSAIVAAAMTRSDPSPLPDAAAIVVLSGPGAAGEMSHGQARARVLRAVGVWKAGAAPALVMTGGGGRGGRYNDAYAMARLAVSLGVPEPAIVIEPLADSTLQNAYYAAETGGLRRDDPLIVVTSRYHLPRALVSFRLAGYRNLHGIAATPRVDPRSGDLHAEVVKWPANLLRGGAARLALGLGIPRDRVMPWLR